jgi:hypothetical protein
VLVLATVSVRNNKAAIDRYWSGRQESSGVSPSSPGSKSEPLTIQVEFNALIVHLRRFM